MQCQSTTYKGYRFPREIMSYAVWIYYRLNASLRDTSQALSYRGVDASHEISELGFINLVAFMHLV